MNWSLRIGRFLGIDVFIHLTFLLVLGFIAVANWMATGSPMAVLGGVGFFLALFGCVLLHEYGHALAARAYGIGTKDITLLPIGGVARLERMPDRPWQELWVAVAGPAVNVAIALVLAVWLSLTGSWEPLTNLSATSGGFAARLLVVNIMLVLFNMIPAFPMDGGRVLRAVLAMRLEYAHATRIAATVGQTLAVLFAFIGFLSNPMLILIALFIWLGAGQEAAATEMKASLGSLPVREAMLTDFRTLSPRDNLADAARLLIEGSQQDFPVTESGVVVGVLTHRRLLEMLQERGEWTYVGDVMERDFQLLSPDEPLDRVLGQCLPGATAIPVVRHNRIVGLLTAENVGELMMIQTARSSPRSPSKLPPPLPRRLVRIPIHSS